MPSFGGLPQKPGFEFRVQLCLGQGLKVWQPPGRLSLECGALGKAGQWC